MIDLKGLRFGRLVVIGFDGRCGYKYLWRCVCDCGNIKVLDGKLLREGRCKSCGCLKAESNHLRKGEKRKPYRHRFTTLNLDYYKTTNKKKRK